MGHHWRLHIGNLFQSGTLLRRTSHVFNSHHKGALYSRGIFSLINTFRYLTTTAVNQIFGKLILSFGTRKLLCAGFICLIALTTLNVATIHIGTFYLGSVFLGLGMSWTGTTMVNTVINQWRPSNKGTIMNRFWI